MFAFEFSLSHQGLQAVSENSDIFMNPQTSYGVLTPFFFSLWNYHCALCYYHYQMVMILILARALISTEHYLYCNKATGQIMSLEEKYIFCEVSFFR